MGEFSPAALVRRFRPQQPSGAQTQVGESQAEASPQQPPPKIVARSEIFRTRGHSIEINQGRAETTPYEKRIIKIIPETVQRYTVFLEDFVTTMRKVIENNPSLRDNPIAQPEIALYEKLTESGKIAEPEKVATNINSFLEGANWELVRSVSENFASYGQPALAIYAQIDPEGQRELQADNQLTHRLGGQGLLNRFRHNFFEPVIHAVVRHPWIVGANIAGGIGSSGIAAVLTREPSMAIPAAVAAPIITAAAAGEEAVRRAAFRSWQQEGTRLSLRLDPQAFNELQNNPNLANERAYIQAMYGIDMSLLELAGSTVRKKTGVTTTMSRTFSEVRGELAEALYARRGYLENLGVKPEKIDALPEQFLADGSLQPEQLGTYLGEEILRRFNPNQGGIRDLWNRTLENPHFGIDPTLIPLPGVVTVLLPDYTKVDRIGNIQRFQKARQEAMMSVLLKEANEILNVEQSARAKKIIEEKDVKASVIALDHKIEQLTQNKTDVEGRRTALQPIDEKQAAIKEKEGELDTKYHLPAGADFQARVQAELDKIENELENTTAVPPIGLRVDLIAVTTDWNGTYEAAVDDAIRRRIAAGIASDKINMDPIETNAEKMANVKHGRRLAEVQKKINEHETRQNELIELKKSYESAQAELSQAELDFSANAEKDFVATKEAYESLVGPAVVGPTINSANLETLTIEELTVRATAPPYGFPNTTPQEKAALREKIIRAKTEHRAVQIESYDASPPVQTAAFNAVTTTGGPLNADNILTFPKTELLHILDTDYGGVVPFAALVGLLGKEKVLSEAQREAQKKLRIRHQAAIEVETKDIDVELRRAKERKEHLELYNPEGELIEVAKDLLGRQSQIYGKIPDMIRGINAFTDTAVVGTTATDFLEAERTLGAPRGYFAILDLLFDYKLKESIDRNKFVQKIARVLPPDRLSAILNRHFIVGPMPIDIVNSLDVIKNGVEAGSIGEIEMYKALRGIITEVQNDAVVL